MKIFLNEIVSKNTTVSNNIIVVSNENEADRVKNTMENPNPFMPSPKSLNEAQFTAQSFKKSSDNAKMNYLTSKHSIIDKKPEALLQSFDSQESSSNIKFPVVSNPTLQSSSTKNNSKNK